MQDFDSEQERASTLSRRAIIAAGAWAAPVVVVASALPAMAVSTVVDASLAYHASGTYAARGQDTLTVGGQLTYQGGPSSGTLSQPTITVSVPSSSVSAADPVVAGKDWTLVGNATSGSNRNYVFVYNGPALSDTNPNTAPLVATSSTKGSSNQATVDVVLTASAYAKSQSIIPITTVLHAGTPGTLGFNELYSGGSYQAFHMGIRPWNSGPYNGAEIAVQYVEVTYSDDIAYVPTISEGNASWSLVDRGVSGGQRTVRFIYLGGSLVPYQSTAKLALAFAQKNGNTKGVFQISATGTSAGAPLSVVNSLSFS